MTKKNAVTGDKRDKTKRETISKQFTFVMLDRTATSKSSGEVWLPLVEGTVVHKAGSSEAPFAGFIPNTSEAIYGKFIGLPLLPGMFESRPAGRPQTADLRDVAVFIAYTAMELFNPKLGVQDLRRLVVKAWAGNLPDFGSQKYRGILENKHVKRSMVNALKFAPELADPIRSKKNLPLFNLNKPLAGAYIETLDVPGGGWAILFVPSPQGKTGTPESRDGFDGLSFPNITAWLWRVGKEHAEKLQVSHWRPINTFTRITVGES